MDKEYFEKRIVHCLRFVEDDFFIEPSGNKKSVLIQFGRGHLEVPRKKFLKALLEYDMMFHDTYTGYKEAELLKRIQQRRMKL